MVDRKIARFGLQIVIFEIKLEWVEKRDADPRSFILH
jgi:hypothetical protein